MPGFHEIRKNCAQRGVSALLSLVSTVLGTHPHAILSSWLWMCGVDLRVILPPPFMLAWVSYNYTCQPPLQLAVAHGLQQWKEWGERTKAWCFPLLHVSVLKRSSAPGVRP